MSEPERICGCGLRSPVANRPVERLPDGTYLARMNLAGQKGVHLGGVLVRVIEYQVDGGETVRLLTDLIDRRPIRRRSWQPLPERWEAESAFRQIKTFQRGPAEVLRSGDPDLVRQEVWAHLVVHHCLTRIIMDLAKGNGIDPDRLSFVKVLKHAARSVVRHCAGTPRRSRILPAWQRERAASSTMDSSVYARRIGSSSGQTLFLHQTPFDVRDTRGSRLSRPALPHQMLEAINAANG